MVRLASNRQTSRTMYDPEYFPTPSHVIYRMLAPYCRPRDVGRYDYAALQDLTILDPSAGNGAILNYVADLFGQYQHKPTLHAIEVNPDMQPVLREKFTLVHDDFLTFQTDVRYDLILMNPPFSNGDAHLEHAWKVMQHGDIVCLLNAETIRNPYTERRKWLVQLIEDHGSVEYIGSAFRASQRPTDVEVAMVRLTKHDERDRFSFWEDEQFAPEQEAFSFSEETMANVPAVNNFIAATVQQYQASQQAYVDYLKAYKRLKYHATAVIDREKDLDEMLAASIEQPTGKRAFNHFVTALQAKAWDLIFQRTAMNDLMSEGVRKDFDVMRKQQGGMPFTEANIRNLLQMLFLNRDVILQRCVEEAFDLMTSYHDGNKSHYEGWKTNDAYKVNRKVIIPDWALSYDRQYGSWSSGYWQGRWKWDDIDRACAMLEGKRLSSPSAMPSRAANPSVEDSKAKPVYTIRAALDDRFRELNANRRGEKYVHYRDNVCESEYFHIKFWKKGTVHLVFKDEWMWQRFNQQAALGKKWLPSDKDRTPTPTSDPADQRYAKRLAEDNAENRKLLIAA